VAQRVLSSLRRQVEEVGSDGRPSGFGGEPGDVLVGLVKLSDDPGSDELFGRYVQAVRVALNRLKKPPGWIVQLAQHGVGGDRRFITSEDLLQRLSRRAR
jgi:hypothetical protein